MTGRVGCCVVWFDTALRGLRAGSPRTGGAVGCIGASAGGSGVDGVAGVSGTLGDRGAWFDSAPLRQAQGRLFERLRVDPSAGSGQAHHERRGDCLEGLGARGVVRHSPPQTQAWLTTNGVGWFRHGLPKTLARLTTNGGAGTVWRAWVVYLGGWFDTALRGLRTGSPRTGGRDCLEGLGGVSGGVVRHGPSRTTDRLTTNGGQGLSGGLGWCIWGGWFDTGRRRRRTGSPRTGALRQALRPGSP